MQISGVASPGLYLSVKKDASLLGGAQFSSMKRIWEATCALGLLEVLVMLLRSSSSN